MGRLQFLVASIFSSPPKGTRCIQYVVTSMPNVCGSLCSNEGVVRFSSLGQSLTFFTHSGIFDLTERRVVDSRHRLRREGYSCVSVFFEFVCTEDRLKARPQKKKKKKKGGGKKKKKKKKKKK